MQIVRRRHACLTCQNLWLPLTGPACGMYVAHHARAHVRSSQFVNAAGPYRLWSRGDLG